MSGKITAKDLTNQQRIFADTYLASDDFNGTAAYLIAYPNAKAKGAEASASRLLRHVKVNAYIMQSMEERSKTTKVNADYVLKRLVEIDQMDALDILEDDGSLKPIREWPKVWRTYLSGIDVVETNVDDGVMGMLKKVKWPDKTKNLELIGKHIDVQAFKERVGLDLNEDVTPWASIKSGVDKA